GVSAEHPDGDAVDRHAACLDEPLRSSPGGHPGGGEDLLEADQGHGGSATRRRSGRAGPRRLRETGSLRRRPTSLARRAGVALRTGCLDTVTGRGARGRVERRELTQVPEPEVLEELPGRPVEERPPRSCLAPDHADEPTLEQMGEDALSPHSPELL